MKNLIINLLEKFARMLNQTVNHLNKRKVLELTSISYSDNGRYFAIPI